MKRRVCAISIVRLQSSRVPRKMIQEIGGKPLCEWALGRLQQAAKDCQVDCGAVICPDEVELMEIATRLEITVLPRTITSAVSNEFETIYEQKWVRPLCDSYDWILVINSSLPFVPISSYQRFIELAKTAMRPFISAFRYRGYVWDENGKALLEINKPLDTKTSPVYMVPSHCFYGFSSDLFGTPEAYFSLQPVEVPKDICHCTDIDTMDDLRMARAIHDSGCVR